MKLSQASKQMMLALIKAEIRTFESDLLYNKASRKMFWENADKDDTSTISTNSFLFLNLANNNIKYIRNKLKKETK